MIKLLYPPYQPKIRQQNGREWILDEVRKKWVALTPEEWVRQNFLQYLLQAKRYPAALIAVEKTLAIADVKKRFDIVVYKNELPWMMVECKEMNVPLDGKVLDQALRYNQALQVSYIVITNGSNCIAYSTSGTLQLLDDIPGF
ncbi:MAG: hypothetical protein RL172_1476 [Bacteroidota bacterium]|jgi:hypothetical protein